MDYLYFLQNCREGALHWLNWIMYPISEVGLIASLLSVFVIYWAIDKNCGKKFLFGFSFSILTTNLIKNIACISRPWILDRRLHVDPLVKKTATGFSFPSGHSTSAASSFSGIAYWKKNNKIVSSLMIVLIFAVMFSRNWLGAHTLQDVLTAFFIGIIFTILSFVLLDRIEKDNISETLFFTISLVIGISICFFIYYKKYPFQKLFDSDGNLISDIEDLKLDGIKQTANFIGFICGWFLERKILNFKVPEKNKDKLLVSIIGISVVGLLNYAVLPLIFSKCSTLVSGFSRHFILFFWATFGYPAVVSCFIKK